MTASASASLRRIAGKSSIVLGIAAVLIIGSALSPYFLTGRNLQNIVITGSVVSVLAVGQFLVIVTAGIDLSVGAIAALATVVAAVLMRAGWSAPTAVLATLMVCALAGAINGVLVVFGRITPFIATLAMLSVAQGVAFIVQTGTLIPITDAGFLAVLNGRLLGMPVPVFLSLATMLVFAAVMRWTTFGRQLYAIGGNREAARLSGLPVTRNLLSVYALSGLLAGLAGVMLAAQLAQGSSLVASGYELSAIAAAVVGGASLFGGTGNPVLAVVGGLLIGTVENIMNLRGIQAQEQLLIKGLIILLAVFLTSGAGTAIGRRLRTRRRTSAPVAAPDDPGPATEADGTTETPRPAGSLSGSVRG
jgi:ribose transport system permease protein